MNIVLLDEHVGAFLLWEKERTKGLLKPSDVLLHVDSHDDLSYPDKLDESLYKMKEPRRFLRKNLTIASFVIPAALRGCFSTIYDVRPRNKPDPLAKKTVKGEAKEKVKKGAEIIEFCSWKDEGLLWYQNLTPHGKRLAYASRGHQIAYHLVHAMNKVPSNVAFILDIDMDYFSCNVSEDYQFKPKLTRTQLGEAKRFSMSDDKYKVNLGLVSMDQSGRMVDVSAYRNDQEVGRIYNDDPLWIEYGIRQFVSDIKKRPEPKMVSIARSVKTGYTPRKHADLIEGALKDHFRATKLIGLTPPYEGSFELQDNIFYDPKTNHIINQYTLEEYALESRPDVVMWEMMQEGARFGDIIECLVKDHQYSRRKAETELVSGVWYLKKEMVLK